MLSGQEPATLCPKLAWLYNLCETVHPAPSFSHLLPPPASSHLPCLLLPPPLSPPAFPCLLLSPSVSPVSSSCLPPTFSYLLPPASSCLPCLPLPPPISLCLPPAFSYLPPPSSSCLPCLILPPPACHTADIQSAFRSVAPVIDIVFGDNLRWSEGKW